MRKALFVCSLAVVLVNFVVPVNLIVAQESPKPDHQVQVTATPLQNEDVLKLTETGLSTDIIVAKIKASVCKFDTTPEALQKLKTANVPEPVIMAMVQAPYGLAASAPDASKEAEGLVEIKIPDGTPLEVELMSTISSGSSLEGDVIDFIVVSPVFVDGVMVIEKGAPAKARIAAVKKAGYWGKAGKLGWTMQDVLLVDGSRKALRMDKRLVGDSKGGTVATGTIITAVVFWPAAPFWGLKKGKNAVYKTGTRFNAFVHGDAFMKANPNAATQTPPVPPQEDSQVTTPAKP